MKRSLLLVLAGVCLCRPALAQEGLRAGAYAMNVTPPRFPISVNGGMADRLAKRAHDLLHARCLVLDDGRQKLVLVVVDSCMIPRELIDAAKAKVQATVGIPPEQICISATHTHSAPTLTGDFQSEPDREYVAFLTE